MTTHGTGETPNALPSPSSRVHATPSDGEPQAEAPVVVDVTGSDAPWTGTSARQTSNPPPLRTSKRAAAKAVSTAALAKARMGKKKLTKRSTPAATSTRRLARAVLESSESEPEDKSSPPPKKAKKTMPTSRLSATDVALPPPTSRLSATDVVLPPPTSRADSGFDLSTFMETFEPGLGGTERSRPSQETERLRDNDNDRQVEAANDPVMAELNALKAEVSRLRSLVGNAGVAGRDRASPPLVTTPNTKGELPPPEVRYLTSASFPEGAKKAKGDYNPPQAHLLAASRMFRDFGTDTVSTCEDLIEPPLSIASRVHPPETLRSGLTIQSPTVSQPPPTIRSGTSIQSHTALQLPLTLRSGSTIQSPTTLQSYSMPSKSLPLSSAVDQQPGTTPENYPPASAKRPVICRVKAAKLHDNTCARRDILKRTRKVKLGKAMAEYGITMPSDDYPHSRVINNEIEYLLNTPLQHALSEFARLSKMSLPTFMELFRDQTAEDYRPNKNIVPAVLDAICMDYKQRDRLLQIAREGVKVQLSAIPPRQTKRPPNHGSARDRVNILRKNIRKEQDAGRCLVLDLDLLEQWPEIVISPFGVVDKGGEATNVSGRTIHDLSYPEGSSVNDCTDQASIVSPDYRHCDTVASEILRVKKLFPRSEIMLMAGDVAAAFRNIGIHSNSVYLFAGQIKECGVLVIELCAPFGWTGSPGFYEIVGGAISHVHGSHTNSVYPTGFFNYHWVDDHINVAANIGSTCADIERSLRFAMAAVLGADAINEEKFTSWSTRQRVLGLEFDSVTEKVSMPVSKVEKAKHIVANAFLAPSVTRKVYRSLMGSLRHVATCIRAARPFLQRLRLRESQLHRFQRVCFTDAMKQDLLWWWQVLHTPNLNGVSLEYFNALPPPDVDIEMDASDFGLCALDAAAQTALTYQFSANELYLIDRFKSGVANGFDINFRELLSCAFAVYAWGHRWSASSVNGGSPCHVRFHIDNTSAVAWQNKMASRNDRAQVIIRLLSWWETSFHLRFSAVHVSGSDNVRADAGSRIAANPSYLRLFDSLTAGWTQVSPQLDIQGLTDLWRRISELTPLSTPLMTNIAGP